jgi:outer membrane receptor protein involved in Fe transport
LDSGVNVYIDGVSQKDYVSGGSGFAGSAGATGNGDPGNPFPELAIGEYKVVTSNYGAEYGDASSTIIVAQTKSGTNQFHGEAFGDYTDQNLRARTPAEVATHSAKAKEPSYEYGLAFGGPIIKDVMHFFFTWEHKDLSDQGDVYPGSGVTQAFAQQVLPKNIGDQYGPVTNPFTEDLYFGKIDFEPSSQDRVEASINWRLENNITGGSGQAAASTEAPYVNDVKREDIRWQHSGNNWVNEARLSYQDVNSSTNTHSTSPQDQYTYYPDAANSAGGTLLIITGGPGSGIGAISAQKGYNLADDLTFANVRFAGDHTFKLGVNFGDLTLTSANASSNLANATYYYAITPNGVAPYPDEVQFPNLTAGYKSASVTTRDKQYSAYVQDTWEVNEHLELNLGLRLDREEVPAYLNYVTPANVVAALNGPFPGLNQSYASVLAIGAPGSPPIHIGDYVSTGSNRKAPNNFAPRLGFSYDLNADGRHVIYGGYARSYNRNLYGTLALETTKVALNGNPQVYFPSAQTQDAFGNCFTAADINPANHCYAWDPSYLTPAGLATLQTSPTSHEVDLLHNNIKTPYSDQVSLGIRNKVGDWNTQATVSYIAGYDGIVGHFGNRYANGAYFQNGSQWGAQGVPGVGTLILWDNAAKDEDFQIGLAAQKPYTRQSGWSTTISYTFSSAKQNNVAGGSNPYQVANNQYLFDLPSPSDYQMLTSSAVPTHRVVATYTHDLPWGLSMAAKLTLATPTSAFAIFCCSNPNQYGGAVGPIVSERPKNFLGYKDLDLQVTKDFRLLNAVDVYARIDVFNLFNFHNYDPNAIQFSTLGVRPTYNTAGPILGTPLTLKFTLGARF